MEGMYCAYLRKSRADEVREKVEEGYDALSHHRQALEALASRMEVDLSRWYSDGIKSGERIEGRDGMRELLADVQARRWDGVLCMEVERLTRGDMIDQGTVLRAFHDTGTLIVTPTKVYDPASEADMEYFEFGLFMSRREFKTINKRLIAGRAASVREGQFIAKDPPFGYDKARISGLKTLAPNADAPHVVRIFEAFAAGDSYKTIVRSLDAAGVRPVRGTAWSTSSIQNIVRNPVYVGKVRWNDTRQEVYYENGRRRSHTKANPDAILVDGLHQPIVSQELWDAVSDRIASAPVRGSYEHRNPFGRILVCAECGKALVWAKPSHCNGSECFTHRHRGVGCRTKGCRVSVLEKAVVDALEQIAGDLDLAVGHEAPVAAVTAADCLAEAEQARKAISDNFDRMERGVISEADFVERRAVLEARIAESEAEAARIESMSAEAAAARAATVRDCIRAIGDHSIPVELRRKAIWAAIERIEYQNRAPVFKDEIELRIIIR